MLVEIQIINKQKFDKNSIGIQMMIANGNEDGVDVNDDYTVVQKQIFWYVPGVFFINSNCYYLGVLSL